MTDENDDLDRTVIMPSPGRRRGGAAPTDTAAPTPVAPAVTRAPSVRQAAPSRNAEVISVDMMGKSGENHLINAATMIFSLARQLRNTAQHSDVEGLSAHVSGLLQNYEKNCISKGITPSEAYEARYILCAFLDEIVLNTPWGHGSMWSNHSLLSTLHNDTTGGERFFQILSEKANIPAQNQNLLELMYHCLGLGFQGKFAVQDNGRAALEQIGNGLYRTLRQLKGEPDLELSANWQPVSDGRPTVAKLIPSWVVAAVLGGILLVGYVSFLGVLNNDSDEAFTDIGKLGREVPQMIKSRKVVAPLVDPAVSTVNLTQLKAKLEDYLKEYINNRQVTLSQQQYEVKITIHNKGLFASASATVSDSHVELLANVAAALSGLPGPISVLGHSDSDKINTFRFPSNWHLSDARARSVVAVLVDSEMSSDSLVAMGKADAVPLASNETAAGKEQNRRIEIVIRSY
jgi:type VI secretion system protein ImpK